MRACVAVINGEECTSHYEVKEITMKNGEECKIKFRTTDTIRRFEFDDDSSISTNCVRAIEKTPFVLCRGCNKLIPNNQRSIVSHIANMEKKRNCEKCSSHRFKELSDQKEKLKKLEDGTYLKTTEQQVRMYCYNSYSSSYSLDDERVLENCRFTACRRYGQFDFSKLLDQCRQFVRIPRVADLEKYGWKYVRRDRNFLYYSKYTEESHKTLYARVLYDFKVFDFVYSTKNTDDIKLVYMDKINKLAVVNSYSNYELAEDSDYTIPQYVYSEIAKLYN